MYKQILCTISSHHQKLEAVNSTKHKNIQQLTYKLQLAMPVCSNGSMCKEQLQQKNYITWKLSMLVHAMQVTKKFKNSLLIKWRWVLGINKIAINKAITGLKHYSNILYQIFFYAHI